MKNIKYKRTAFAYALPFLVTLVFTQSCDDQLDIATTQQTEESFFADQSRVQRGIGGVYAGMEYFYGANFDGLSVPVAEIWNVSGDDLTNVNSPTAFDAHQGITAGNNKVNQWWNRHYVNIGRANFMLDKLDDPAIIALFTDPELIDFNKGEMYFLRAWNYSRINEWFGKGPIIQKRLEDLSESNVPMSNSRQLLEQVIKDLELAEEMLPESWASSSAGRVTKNSARGLLVRAYNLKANYEKDNGAYADAIKAFNRIAGAELMPHFADNFDYRKENNLESLFEYQASLAPVQDHPWVPNDNGSDNAEMGFYVGLYIQNHWGGGMIACYPAPTGKLIAAFDPADPRLTNTVALDGKFPAGINPAFDNGGSWFGKPQFIKYLNGARGAALANNAWSMNTSNNPRIIRYADVKLLVAEAYLETGNEGEARKLVNDVRARARKSTTDGTEAAQPADYTSAITMNEIIHERYLELAGEDGIRWNDLKRWHAAGFLDLGTWKYANFVMVDKLDSEGMVVLDQDDQPVKVREYIYTKNYANGSQGFGFNWSEADFGFEVSTNLRFPIPQTEITNNTAVSNADQNFGF